VGGGGGGWGGRPPPPTPKPPIPNPQSPIPNKVCKFIKINYNSKYFIALKLIKKNIKKKK